MYSSIPEKKTHHHSCNLKSWESKGASQKGPFFGGGDHMVSFNNPFIRYHISWNFCIFTYIVNMIEINETVGK